MTVLSQAALGRATLARQMLLAPADCDPVEAIVRLVGLQAQATTSRCHTPTGAGSSPMWIAVGRSAAMALCPGSCW